MPEAPATVMIVDDEPSLLRMMEVYLTRLGYKVVCFASTEKAWEFAGEERGRVRVAVVDMTMPGMTALDLASKLLAADPELYLIVASGYPMDTGEFERSGPGRVAFLHKPFTPEMLAREIRAAVE